MILYLALLKAFLQHDLYAKHFHDLEISLVKENYPELYRLFACLEALQGESPGNYSTDEFQVAFFSYYPNAEAQTYQPLFDRLRAVDVRPELINKYLADNARRAVAAKAAQQALLIAEGTITDYSAFYAAANELAVEADVEDEQKDFAEDDIVILRQQHINKPGLQWRLPSLNRCLGPLRTGNFGFAFARPETGKTTFLSSELTHFATQLPEDIGPGLWFNSEEEHTQVVTRCYQAALNMELFQLYANPEASKAAYFESTHGKLKVVSDKTIERKRVEELCNLYRPGFIVFDQIDHVKGFQADRDDLELEAIYQWAREIAKVYCPVIGICQAGSSGDGKKWLTMNDVNNSKTGKQGAADWILGIGKTYDETQEFTRFFHLSKNKLPGGADSNPAMRHGRWEVRIKPEVARYEDYPSRAEVLR